MRFALTVAALAVLTSSAHAGPYFRPGFSEIKVGGFQALGESSLRQGFVVPAVVHDSRDGYLLFPGITWNLLDVGYSRGGGKPDALLLGPSLALEEPVKAALRAACRAILPGWDDRERYAILRSSFAPAGPDARSTLAVGPAFSLTAPSTDPSSWRGGWALSFTLAKKWD